MLGYGMRICYDMQCEDEGMKSNEEKPAECQRITEVKVSRRMAVQLGSTETIYSSAGASFDSSLSAGLSARRRKSLELVNLPRGTLPHTILHVRSPESEVVTEELHDEGRVLVALFR